MSSPANTISTEDREIIQTRLLDAPRDLVFKVWTQQEHIGHWWGPNGFTTTTHEMEVKPGGIWRFIMHGPDGTDYNNEIIYREVSPPERLDYDHSDGEEGGQAFHVTVSFEEEGAGTRLTMHITCKSAEQKQEFIKFGAVEGGQQTLARLADYLTKF